MRLQRLSTHLLGAAIVLGLMAAISCGGPTQEAGPSPTPTATVGVPKELVVSTPTATPQGASTPVPTPTPADQPRNGGTITLGEAGISMFDPLNRIGFGWTGNAIVGNVWGQLLRVNLKDRVTVEGDLASGWSVNEDGTVWKFKIRQGVLDHDGNPFTADDAYWTFYRAIQRPNGVPANRVSCLRTYIKPVLDKDKKPLPEPGIEVTAPDELTVRLVAPRAAFVNCLVSGFSPMMPDTYTKPIDTAVGGKYRDLDPAKKEVVGYGPFKVKEAVIDNRMVLERFDKYFRPGHPYLDGLTILSIPDASTRVAAFISGQIDAFPTFSTPSKRDADRVKAELGDKVVFNNVLGPGFRGFEINVQKPPFGPQDDPGARNLRMAVQLAVDRGEVNALGQEGIGFPAMPYHIGWDWIYPAQQWVKEFPAFDTTPDVRAKNLAEAKALMEKQGFGPTNRLKVTHICSSTRDSDECQTTAQELKEIYMDVSVILMSGDAYTQRAEQGDFDFYNESKGLPFNDPDAFSVSVYALFKDGGFNYTSWVNAEYWKLYDQQKVLNSQEKRAPILRQMAKILYDDAVFIGTVRPGLLQGHRTNWKGYSVPSTHADNYSFEDVWLAP